MAEKRQIEIEFVFTKELFSQAYLNMFNTKVKAQNFMWFAVLLVLVFLYNIYNNGFRSADLWYYIPLLGVPLGFLFARAYLPEKWAERTYQRNAGRHFKWIITEDDIQIITDKSKATVHWSYFEKATISDGIILFVTTQKVLTPVPISAFTAADFELFKTWFYKNVGGR